jgi:hypothetical protein
MTFCALLEKGFPRFDRSVSFYELTGGFSGGNDQPSEKAKCIQGPDAKNASETLEQWSPHGSSDSTLA